MPMPNPLEALVMTALEALHAAVERCRVAVSLEMTLRSACENPRRASRSASNAQKPTLNTAPLRVG